MTTLSVLPPFPIFTDIDGQPLEDGFIQIGVANLDPVGNPITVYWDSALLVPAAQPIRTIGGYPSNAGTPGRLYAPSAYSIRVSNKNGSVLYNAANETLLTSDNVSFVQAGANAVTRTVQSKLRDVVSVKDFGAVGDGITVDTLAIQRALNTGKGVVGVAGETYLIGPLTQSTDRQLIDFTGCNLKRINSSPHAAMLTLNGNGAIVMGGNWDGNKANQSGTVNEQFGHAAVTVVGDYCNVMNLSSFDSWGIGIKGANCSYANIRNNRLGQNELYGIYIEGIVSDEYGNEITDNFIDSGTVPGASGIYLTGNNSFTLNQYRWKIARNTLFGSVAAPTGIGITTRAQHGIISENITYGFTMGISADAASRSVISNNNVMAAVGGSGYGIECNGGFNTISGNVVRDCTYGIILSGLVFVQSYNTINGNLVQGCNRSIFVQAATFPARYLTISGNTLIHNLVGAGIYLAGDAKFTNISGNNIIGPGSGVSNGRGVYLDSVGSGVSIVGNRFSGWERACTLYSAGASTYTDITFNDNDCTNDIPSGSPSFLSFEGAAVAGARIVQMWNNSNGGANYNIVDRASNRIIMYSDVFATPEGNQIGGIGSLYISLLGGAGTTLFVKQSGAGNTGWAGK